MCINTFLKILYFNISVIQTRYHYIFFDIYSKYITFIPVHFCLQLTFLPIVNIVVDLSLSVGILSTSNCKLMSIYLWCILKKMLKFDFVWHFTFTNHFMLLVKFDWYWKMFAVSFMITEAIVGRYMNIEIILQNLMLLIVLKLITEQQY